ICGQEKSDQRFLGYPLNIYGAFLEDNTFNRVAFSEYHTSARDKFFSASERYGRLHHRSVWLLFNVHLGDIRARCGADAFGVIKWFCRDYRGSTSCGA
ncbi:hypothetical protein MTO96_042584, partial [Rhipicephalus appendiculatus]